MRKLIAIIAVFTGLISFNDSFAFESITKLDHSDSRMPEKANREWTWYLFKSIPGKEFIASFGHPNMSWGNSLATCMPNGGRLPMLSELEDFGRDQEKLIELAKSEGLEIADSYWAMDYILGQSVNNWDEMEAYTFDFKTNTTHRVLGGNRHGVICIMNIHVH